MTILTNALPRRQFELLGLLRPAALLAAFLSALLAAFLGGRGRRSGGLLRGLDGRSGGGAAGGNHGAGEQDEKLRATS